MPSDHKVCHWRDMRVTRGGKPVSEKRALAALVYLAEHSVPPDGIVIEWPEGVHAVDMVPVWREYDK